LFFGGVVSEVFLGGEGLGDFVVVITLLEEDAKVGRLDGLDGQSRAFSIIHFYLSQKFPSIYQLLPHPHENPPSLISFVSRRNCLISFVSRRRRRMKKRSEGDVKCV
jgi:hypothetical protein